MESLTAPDPDMFRSFVAGFVKAAGKVQPGMFMICRGKIRHPGYSTYVKEIQYLQQILPRERWGDIKLTLPAPNWYHLRYREGYAYPKDVYRDDTEYFHDIAAAYRAELDLLYQAGLRNVQFDDPNLTCMSVLDVSSSRVCFNMLMLIALSSPVFCSEQMLKDWEDDKANVRTPDELFRVYIRLYNDILASRPADLHVGIHLCRGNFRDATRKGGYERIAKTLFQELDVDTYYLEYDDRSRTGGFTPLRYLPKTKNVILGVITSKSAELEDEEVKRRVLEAAETIAEGNAESKEDALKRIGVSPQCGFASIAEGRNMEYDDMVNKLKLVRQVADDLWPGEP